MSKPVLVLGYGNPSRGDDALGPLLLDFIQQHMNTSQLELLTDFQLQIEHALDLQNRELVLFIDASVACAEVFDFAELHPAIDRSYTSHAMSPTAVLHVYQSVTGEVPPPAFLLSIKGLHFELGEDLSQEAASNFQLAASYLQKLLLKPQVENWRRQAFNSTALAC